MSKPTTVYAVVSGDYSDYGVHAVFLFEADAQKVVDEGNTGNRYPSYDVQEFLMFDGPAEKVTQYSMVEVIRDSTTPVSDEVVPEREVKYPWEFWDGIPPKVRARYVRAPVYHNRAGRLEVRGTDLQAVKQVFSQHRAAIYDQLAQGHTPMQVKP